MDSMNIKLFTTKYSQVMNKALDSYSRQHKAIAENVANASDPNSKRVNTDFSSTLQQTQQARLRCSDPRHFKSIDSPETNSINQEGALDESIDLMREMADLAEMQIRYDFVSRTLSRYYNGVSTAITGRQR